MFFVERKKFKQRHFMFIREYHSLISRHFPFMCCHMTLRSDDDTRDLFANILAYVVQPEIGKIHMLIWAEAQHCLQIAYAPNERISQAGDSLRIAGWSESSLSSWRVFESLATHRVPCEVSDQNARMRKVIWIRPSCKCFITWPH